MQVDINNNNRLDDDIIYSFEKSKKDSIVSNLPELKVSFKYNDNGVIKDGSSLIKINPFDKYYTSDYYKSLAEKESDFVIKNNQYREGVLISGKDSLILEVSNIFPYPDFVNQDLIILHQKKENKIQIQKNFQLKDDSTKSDLEKLKQELEKTKTDLEKLKTDLQKDKVKSKK